MILTFKAPRQKRGEFLCNITGESANATRNADHRTGHCITQISKQFFIEGLPRNGQHTDSMNIKVSKGRCYRARNEKSRQLLLIC